MRRVFILLLLIAGLQLIYPLGEQRTEAMALPVFGFLILAAYTVGELAAGIRLPKIVGYLAAGFAFGPAALEVVGADVVSFLAPVNQLAIGLIAFLAGAELQWREVRERGVLILKMMSSELLVSFLFILGTLVAMKDLLPFMRGAPMMEVLVFAVLFASVAIVHSPAVTMALLSETGARGPVARTTLGIVLVADVAVVLFFALTLAITRGIVPPGGAEVAGASVIWEVGGAILVGALLGWAVALYLRFVERELFIFAIVVAFFGSEIARVSHVEALLTLLTAGFVAENFSGGRGDALREAMGRAAAPVFVVFFALAGAKISPQAIAAMWMLVIPLFFARAFGIRIGTWVGARWAGAGAAESRYAWMGLISQAGVAIGLSSIIATAYPRRGEELRTLFLAIIAINETVGPILFRRALDRSGETRAAEAIDEPTAIADDGAARAPAATG